LDSVFEVWRNAIYARIAGSAPSLYLFFLRNVFPLQHFEKMGYSSFKQSVVAFTVRAVRNVVQYIIFCAET